jgi:hypothetical protein
MYMARYCSAVNVMSDSLLAHTHTQRERHTTRHTTNDGGDIDFGVLGALQLLQISLRVSRVRMLVIESMMAMLMYCVQFFAHSWVTLSSIACNSCGTKKLLS